MTRRRRLLILLVALVVGLPLLVAIGIGAYLRSGGVERELARGWAARGLPGQLRVDQVRLTGIDEAHLEGISIGEAGQDALITARRATVQFDVVGRRVKSIRLDEVTATFDVERLSLLIAIIEAEARHPAGGTPSPVRIDVSRGTAVLPGGLQIDDIAVRVDALGATSSVDALGSIAGRPVRLAISTERASQIGPMIITIDAREGVVSPGAVLAALVDFKIISRPHDWLLAELPPLVDVAGCRVACNAMTTAWAGRVQLGWPGGRVQAELDASPRLSALRSLIVEDERLGALRGQLTFEPRLGLLALDADMWRVGKGMPVPPVVPMEELTKQLPKLQMRWPTPDRRFSLTLVGSGQSRLELLVGGDKAPRLRAAELPLTMVQSLLPQPLVIAGGHVVEALAVLDPGREDVHVRVRDARLLANGWSFGTLDGIVAARALPAAGIQVKAELLIGSMPSTMSFTGTMKEGTLSLECKQIEGLLARLHGPVQVPMLTGEMKLDASYSFSPGETRIGIANLEVRSADLQLLGRDFVRAVTASMRGKATFAAGRIDVELGGHLRTGEVRLPGLWMDAAVRTPIFRVDIGIGLEQGVLSAIELRQALVRSAGANGDPIVGGYSAQFDGLLQGERLAGRFTGVVDHADLSWVKKLISSSPVNITGEGAIACSVDFDRGEVLRIDGSFLPLGADLDVDRGRLRVEGITGGIHFWIGEGKP